MRSLEHQGVNTIFGYPGGQAIPIYDSLDPAARLTILAECEGERLHVCFANRARRELARVESNHIGLRTCEAILQLLGGQFFTHRTGDDFSAEFVLPRTPPDAAQG